MEVRDKVRHFINQNLIVFNAAEAQYEDSDNIFSLGLVNSLFAMQLLQFVESEFAVVVDNDEIDISNFSSIDNITGLVEKKLREKAS